MTIRYGLFVEQVVSRRKKVKIIFFFKPELSDLPQMMLTLRLTTDDADSQTYHR